MIPDVWKDSVMLPSDAAASREVRDPPVCRGCGYLGAECTCRRKRPQTHEELLRNMAALQDAKPADHFDVARRAAREKALNIAARAVIDATSHGITIGEITRKAAELRDPTAARIAELEREIARLKRHRREFDLDHRQSLYDHARNAPPPGEDATQGGSE